MALEVTRSADDVFIAVSGTFDASAASRLCSLFARLTHGDGTGHVVIDFGHVREVTDIALAALVEYQGHTVLRLRFRGLSQHHNRMLRYLAKPSDAKG